MRFSLLLSLLTLVLPAAAWAEFRLATFSADITVGANAERGMRNAEGNNSGAAGGG